MADKFIPLPAKTKFLLVISLFAFSPSVEMFAAINSDAQLFASKQKKIIN
jgi:hypothetical protein